MTTQATAVFMAGPCRVAPAFNRLRTRCIRVGAAVPVGSLGTDGRACRQPQDTSVHHEFRTGGKTQIVGDRDSGRKYSVDLVNGGRAGYPKRMVDRIKPLMQEEVTGLPQIVMVADAVDDDTVRLESGDKARLIGVDTPEGVWHVWRVAKTLEGAALDSDTL